MISSTISRFSSAITDAKRSRFLTVIVFIALLQRIALVVLTGQFSVTEKYEPFIIAQNVVEGHGYVWHWEYGSRIPERAATYPPYKSAYMPPLLTGFYVALIGLFGTSKSALDWMMIIQSFLGALLPIILYRLGCHFGSEATGRWSAVLTLCYLPGAVTAIVFSGVVLYQLLLPLVMLLLIRLHRTRTIASAGLLGLCGGALALMRSECYILVPLLAILSLFCFQPPSRVGRTIALASVFAVLFLVTTGWWTVRNYNLFERFVPVTSHPWREVWKGFNPIATGSNVGIHGENVLETRDEFRHIAVAMDSIPYDRKFEVNADDILKQEVFAYVSDHPTHALSLFLKKIVMFWTIDPYYPQARSLLFILPTLFISLTGLIGLFRNLKSGDRYLNLLFGVMALMFTLTFALTCALPRYQVFVLPIMIPFAAILLSQVLRLKSSDLSLKS